MKGKTGSVLMILGYPARASTHRLRPGSHGGRLRHRADLRPAGRHPHSPSDGRGEHRACVRGEENGWLKVEFQDPQYGIRNR